MSDSISPFLFMVSKLHKIIQKKILNCSGATIDHRILQNVLLIKKITFGQIWAKREFFPKHGLSHFLPLWTSNFMHQFRKN